uniref:Uncharacterized protein n=1 Tax=Clytia hemisphaerica TaxID=252671 RepID=A0A7M5XKN2_9CNID
YNLLSILGADEAKKIFENFKKIPKEKAKTKNDKYKFFHWFNEFTRKRKSTTNSKSKKRKVRGKNADIKELLKGINTSESEDANYDDFDSDEEMDLARISPAATRQTLPSNNNQADTFRSSGSEKDEDSKDDEEMGDPEVRETEKERELRGKKQKQQK